MTKKFENTPRAQQITTLFQLHEDAVAAYKTAANDGMENSDPAQFITIQETMHKAYGALVDFIDTPAEAAPATDAPDTPANKKRKKLHRRDLVPVFKCASELLPEHYAGLFRDALRQAIDAGYKTLTVAFDLPDTCRKQQPALHAQGRYTARMPKYARYEIVETRGNGFFTPLRVVNTPAEVLAALVEMRPDTSKNSRLEVYGMGSNGLRWNSIALTKWAMPKAQDTPEAA